MIRIILLLFLSALCWLTWSHTPQPTAYQQKVPYVSPVLQPYVNEFLKDMDISRYYELDSILFVGQSSQICNDDLAVGCCNNTIVKLKKPPYLIVDMDMYLRVVVYHELGHCVLRLDHQNKRQSIMNPSPTQPLAQYRKWWGMYRYEMMRYYFKEKHKGDLINFRKQE
jgi:hypothetical protein